MKKKRKIICLAVVIFSALFLTSCVGKKQSIRFGTAGVGGVYYSFGEAVAQILSSMEDEPEIEVKETAGSVANLRLLSENYIQMGMAQTVLMLLYARFVVFSVMGRDYDAAVISAGTCGFGMGPRQMRWQTCRQYAKNTALR